MNFPKWEKSYLTELAGLKNDFRDEKKLKLPVYRQSLKYLVKVLVYLESSKQAPDLADYETTIQKQFQGQMRDYLLCDLLLKAKDKDSGITFTKEQYEKLLKNFLASCQNENYRTYIQKATTTYSFRGKQALVKADNTSAAFSDVVSQGNITYVDFWASWCAPCRAELPESKKLKAEFAQKGVHFIYISMDENPAAWERAVKQTGISVNDSYLLPGGNKSELAKKFKIVTIPRYMLFDRKGGLISPDAARPSSPGIRKVLNNLVSKK